MNQTRFHVHSSISDPSFLNPGFRNFRFCSGKSIFLDGDLKSLLKKINKEKTNKQTNKQKTSKQTQNKTKSGCNLGAYVICYNATESFHGKKGSLYLIKSNI